MRSLHFPNARYNGQNEIPPQQAGSRCGMVTSLNRVGRQRSHPRVSADTSRRIKHAAPLWHPHSPQQREAVIILLHPHRAIVPARRTCASMSRRKRCHILDPPSSIRTTPPFCPSDPVQNWRRPARCPRSISTPPRSPDPGQGARDFDHFAIAS